MPDGTDESLKTLDSYVRHMEPSCNEEKDFIVLLNQSGVDTLVSRIRSRIEVERQVGEIMTMGRFREKNLTIFCNGKLVLKDFEGEEEVRAFLLDLVREE